MREWEDRPEVIHGDEPSALKRGKRMEEGLRWFSKHFFKPFLYPFAVAGVSPNAITCAGIALALASGYLIASGAIPVGAALFAISGVLDIVDGYVAKRLGKVTSFGSFLDSFSDRLSDAAIYTGILIHYLRLGEGVYAGLSIVLLVNSFLISYVRAKAESLGVECKAGLMARASRFLLLGAGLLFNGLSPWVLRVVLWALSALVFETLVERIYVVWRQLSEVRSP